jgi:hypothetical protein
MSNNMSFKRKNSRRLWENHSIIFADWSIRLDYINVLINIDLIIYEINLRVRV